MIATLKYFKENSDEYNIDDSKIVLGGSSGGAYQVMVAAILLGRDNQSDMIKLLFLNCPMLGRTLEDAP
jgi:acetyl esterase/lipase